MTTTLNTLNTKFTAQAQEILTAQTNRVTTIRETINLCIEYGNREDNKLTFGSKKNAISSYTKTVLTDDVKANTYFTRSLKIAKLHLVDGYKAKFELLTIAQFEQLFSFNKNKVSELMSYEDDLYIDEVKALIKSAKVAKSTKIFSKATAKTIK